MAKRWRLLPLAALALLACIDKGANGPTVEGVGGDPPADTAVCATCQQRAGGETADFGAAPGSGGTCASSEAPLTEEVEQAFELAQLRAFLASPRVVVAEPREVLAGQPALTGPIEIELRFEVGEFTYRMGERCSSVRAPLELTAEVGDGLLSFRAKGALFKEAGALQASLYANADLAAATGSYRPQVDTSRPHIGQIEVSISVFPDQLRGSVLPELIYFQSEEDAQRWLEGKPPAMPGRAALPDFDVLVHLDFPVDDCDDHELPLALDAALELLGGKSPEQLRHEVAAKIETVTSVAAVWRDSSTTVLRVEPGASPAGTVCARSDQALPNSGFSGPELTLVFPAAATLRTEDGKIDMTMDKLAITIGKEQHELRRAALRGIVPHVPGEKLDGWIEYTFANGAVDAQGIVQVLIEVTPGAGTHGDCVAFPPGGKWDTEQCRYMRRL